MFNMLCKMHDGEIANCSEVHDSYVVIHEQVCDPYTEQGSTAIEDRIIEH